MKIRGIPIVISLCTWAISFTAFGVTEEALKSQTKKCMTNLMQSIYRQLINGAQVNEKTCFKIGGRIVDHGPIGDFYMCSQLMSPEVTLWDFDKRIIFEDTSTEASISIKSSLAIPRVTTYHEITDPLGESTPIKTSKDYPCEMILENLAASANFGLFIKCEPGTFPGLTLSKLKLKSETGTHVPFYKIEIYRGYDRLGERMVSLDRIAKVSVDSPDAENGLAFLVNSNTNVRTEIYADLAGVKSCLEERDMHDSRRSVESERN